MKRERELVLDAVALSALLDERKPDHLHARRALSMLAGEGADGPADMADALFVIPAITLYEVRRGLLKIRAARRIRDLDRFLRAYAWVQDFDEQTANTAAELWADRERRGKKPGERDLLIFATAMAADGDVVTRDEGFPTAGAVSVLTWAQVEAELSDGGG